MLSSTKSCEIICLIVLVFVNVLNVACGYSPRQSFDFVVVGGGVAGCTIASRLSESGRFSVLLLEAGPFPHPGLDVPGVSSYFMENGEHVSYTKQYHMQSKIETTSRDMVYTVGRTLGGGSSVNGMVFNRGSPYDWDNWAELTNDSSWRYENMIQYFKRVEHYLGDFPSNQHGYSGHITVSRPTYAPGMETILEAGRSLGYPIADQNGPQQVSFTPIEFSKRLGRRVSAFTGYLKSYLGIRKNLKVITGAKVERILFENQNGAVAAVGVVYSQYGGKKSRVVRGKNEIIVSAGVVESPTLLLKSGIGSTIPKTRMPGKFLHDHVVVRLVFMHIDSTQVLLPERDFTPENYYRYNLTGEGPYSTHDADNVQAFMASSISRNSHWADLQLQFVSSGLSVSSPEDIKPGEVAVSCMLFLGRPKSRGALLLNSTNPDGNPILDFQYLQHPQDMDILLEGIQRVLRVYEGNPSFQKIGARYSTIPLTECRINDGGKMIPFRSREYWKCYIRNMFASGLHGAGTCRMGSETSDPDAVVDPQLRVIGVENLRVVDTSIMPQVTNANTQAPVYAIAERAAELILQHNL